MVEQSEEWAREWPWRDVTTGIRLQVHMLDAAWFVVLSWVLKILFIIFEPVSMEKVYKSFTSSPRSDLMSTLLFAVLFWNRKWSVCRVCLLISPWRPVHIFFNVRGKSHYSMTSMPAVFQLCPFVYLEQRHRSMFIFFVCRIVSKLCDSD